MSNTGACPLAKPDQAMARPLASGEVLPRCGREHSAVRIFLPPTLTDRREYDLFAAALEGCLTRVRYYVEAEGIPLDAVEENSNRTALDFAQWASAQYGADTQAAQRYLRMRVHAALGLVPVVFSGPTAEGEPPRDPHGGEHRLRAGAAVSGQTQGPNAGSSAFPMTRPPPPSPTRGCTCRGCRRNAACRNIPFLGWLDNEGHPKECDCIDCRCLREGFRKWNRN